MRNELLDDLSSLDALEIPIPKQISVGFWRRFGATFLDLFFLSIILNFSAALLDGLYLIGLFHWAETIRMVLGSLVLFLYYPIFESSKYQASIGKKILSMKVVNETGGRLTFGLALGRFLAKWISFVLAFTGFIMIAFTDKEQ